MPSFPLDIRISNKKSKETMNNMPRLCEFIEELNKLRQLITVITGYDVSDVSMFFAEYRYTDHLLTHEDDLQNRIVAFVYYLNRNFIQKNYIAYSNHLL